MKKVMDALREKKITSIGGEEVYSVADYLKGVKVYPSGKEEEITLPKSDVIYLELADGQFICIRPSGTEPKLKIYVLIFASGRDEATAKSANLMSATKKLLEN